jgi:hypothetical protein
MGKPEGGRPLERPRRRWEDGIKLTLTEITWNVVERIHIAQVGDRWWDLLNAVMNPWVSAPRG